MVNCQLVPIKADMPPAARDLMYVRTSQCNCKSVCDSNRCTCQKHGLVSHHNLTSYLDS